MQAELRRFQATIPPEKKGLMAQFDMEATIQAAPDGWGPRLALALCLGTVLKAINMSLTFLADALFTFARQSCEDAGRELSERKKAKIDANICDFTVNSGRKGRSSWPRAAAEHGPQETETGEFENLTGKATPRRSNRAAGRRPEFLPEISQSSKASSAS